MQRYSDLAVRVRYGIVAAALFLIAAILGGGPFVVFVALLAAAFWVEWTLMKMPGSSTRLRVIGLVALFAMATAIVMLPSTMVAATLAAIVGLLAAAMIWLSQPRAIAGFAYAALLLVSLALLRGEGADRAGLVAILFLAAVVWATDIGAYFAGRALGGPRLSPAISPNKTISGAVGGLICAVVAGLIVHAVFGVRSVMIACVLGLVLSVLAQMGDLFESWLKRRAGVKDSGAVIPGHGGIMDRVDGLVFAAIGLWVAGASQTGVTAPARAFF